MKSEHSQSSSNSRSHLASIDLKFHDAAAPAEKQLPRGRSDMDRDLSSTRQGDGLPKEKDLPEASERVARGQAEVLARTLKVLATEPKPDAFVGQILAMVVEHLSALTASLWLSDSITTDLVLTYLSDGRTLYHKTLGAEIGNIPLRVSAAAIQHVRRDVIVRHDEHDFNTQPQYEGFKAIYAARGIKRVAAIPLAFGELYRGWFMVTFQDNSALAVEDEPFVNALAIQALLAIELDRMADQERKAAVRQERAAAAGERTAALASANEVLRDAIAGLQDFEDLDAFVVKMLAASEQTLGASAAGLLVVDHGKISWKMRHIVVGGVAKDINTDPEFALWRSPLRFDERNARLWDKMLSQKSHWWTLSDDPLGQPEVRAWHAARGHYSVVHIPMWRDGVMYGFIALAFSGAGRPPEAKLETAQVLAQQIALAFEFARLGAESRRMAVAREQEAAARASAARLAEANTVLARSTVELSEGDIGAYLASVLRILLERMQVSSGALWLAQVDGTESLFINIAEGCLVPPGADRDTSDELALRAHRHAISTSAVVQDCREAEFAVRSNPDIAASGLYHGLEDIRAHLLSNNVRAQMIVPIFAGRRRFGSFAVTAATPCAWTPDQVELAQALGNQAALAIVMSRLAEDARQAAVIEERNRFARDIHDTLAQDFNAIAAYLQSARRKLNMASVPSKELAAVTAALDTAAETAREGLLAARRSVWTLTPRTPEVGNGLAAALRSIVHRIAPGRVEVVERGTPQPIPAGAEGELLSIAREAVANALQHAGQDAQIKAYVSFGQDCVEVRIEDDGIGFEPDAAESGRSGHFGLWAIQERAARIGGRLDLASQTDGGTKLTVLVPLSIR